MSTHFFLSSCFGRWLPFIAVVVFIAIVVLFCGCYCCYCCCFFSIAGLYLLIHSIVNRRITSQILHYVSSASPILSTALIILNSRRMCAHFRVIACREPICYILSSNVCECVLLSHGKCHFV